MSSFLTVRKLLVPAFLSVFLFSGYACISWLTYDKSEYGEVSLWYPKWACGNCPDMLVIESHSKALSRYTGKNVFLRVTGQFWHKKYSHDSRFGSNEYKLHCKGHFKTNLKMKIYEMNYIFDFFNTQGIFFDADSCTPVRTTAREGKVINAFLEEQCKKP